VIHVQSSIRHVIYVAQESNLVLSLQEMCDCSVILLHHAFGTVSFTVCEAFCLTTAKQSPPNLRVYNILLVPERLYSSFLWLTTRNSDTFLPFAPHSWHFFTCKQYGIMYNTYTQSPIYIFTSTI